MMDKIQLLDILIPTYNREKILVKNLTKLADQIEKISNNSEIRVIVSDNASNDNTIFSIEALRAEFPAELLLLKSPENKGGANNVVKTMLNSTAEWVMFLGDDDFLPDGYIQFVIDQIKSDRIGCVIPGFSSLYKNGSVIVSRTGESIKTKPGLSAILKLSQFGHQLSGLVVHRNQTLEGYLSKPNFRNIYPFIYFISFNLNKYDAIYAPQFQVLVSQGNTKDWGYDDSGLLTEIYQNYLNLFEDQPIKAILTCLVFTYKQQWRLRLSKNPLQSVRAVKHILTSQNLPFYLKVSISIFYPLLYTVFLVKSLLRKVLVKDKN